MQRRSFFAASLAALALVALAAAPARAQSYNWLSPEEVLRAMEENRVPAIFFFEIPNVQPAKSMAWLFNQGDVVLALKKAKFACARITTVRTGGGGRGGRGGGEDPGLGWGAYDDLARELGVQASSALVFCDFDKRVLVRQVDPLDKKDILGLIARTAPENSKRAKATEDAVRDLAQVEKWIEAKKYQDATRRVGMVLGKDEIVARKVIVRAKELETELIAIGNEQLEEGKRLIEEGKTAEAGPLLELTAAAFAKYECGKEAKELLKKIRKS